MNRTPLDDLANAQRELLDAESELLSQIADRLIALEKRVYKVEDLVREVLQRTAGFGQLVETGGAVRETEVHPENEEAGRSLDGSV